VFGNKSSSKPSVIETLIGAKTAVEGNLSFHGGLRVDGSVRGNVTASANPSTLVISELAVIHGNVGADHVTINGEINGDVHAYERLELQPKARVSGDVFYSVMEMHQGAVVNGKLQHAAAKPDTKVVSFGGKTADLA
jgi:cytoskeletal protein CcmA (bactofilin family)